MLEVVEHFLAATGLLAIMACGATQLDIVALWWPLRGAAIRRLQPIQAAACVGIFLPWWVMRFFASTYTRSGSYLASSISL